MINLLPASSAEDVKRQRLRHRISSISTLVLAGYVLTLSAIGGRALYLTNRQKVVSEEIVNLTDQVNRLASLEAVIRQQDDRITIISKYLDGRSLSADEAANFSGVLISRWDYDAAGNQSASLTSLAVQDLEVFAEGLRDKYMNVVIDSLTRNTEGGWEMNLNLMKGGK